MGTLDNIKTLIEFLPSKDVVIAKRLITKRDFDELLLLVTSAITIVKRNFKKKRPKEELLNIDVGKLEDLEGEVLTYLSYFEYKLEEDDECSQQERDMEDMDISEEENIW